jgi:hypothetical protein
MGKTYFAAVVAVLAVAGSQIATRLLEVSQQDFTIIAFIATAFAAVFTFNAAAFIAAAAVLIAMCVTDDLNKNWPVVFVVIGVIGFITHVSGCDENESEKGLRYALVVLEGAAIVGVLLVPSITMIIAIMLGGSAVLAAIGCLGDAS